MASSTSVPAASLCSTRGLSLHTLTRRPLRTTSLTTRRSSLKTRICAKLADKTELKYNKVGDSDLVISEITCGTMTFGEQNTEKEAHEILSYATERGINALDTSEAYPIPMRKETQGKTDLYIGSWLKSQPRDKVILATKVCGYSERSSYLRDNAKVLRVDAANIKESVEKSLKRLGTDYIDLLQIHWPDRYVPLFGEFFYDFSKWRPSVPFVEQLKAFQELIDEGKVRYIGVSNETSYGVMEFIYAAKVEGLPKIVSIQNSYSLLVRCHFELDLVEVCHPNNCNIGLLAYSPLCGGSLSGKYIDTNSEAARKGRLNLFPSYMERYNKSVAREATIKYLELAKKHGLNPVLNYNQLNAGLDITCEFQEATIKYLELAKKHGLNPVLNYNQLNAGLDITCEFQEATIKYLELAKKHGLTPIQLALGFTRDRPFMTSSIIGATSVEQLKEDVDAFLTTERPLPLEVMADIENIFKRYKDPTIL